MATIYDVAEHAGVSISTVSLALNNPSRVSESARARVLKAVDALGYRPKSDAVSRARRGVGRIGVLAPFTSYPSFYERLNGVIDELGEGGGGLELVIFDHESAASSTSPLIDTLPLVGQLDGLIVMGVALSESAAKRVAGTRFPIVTVDVHEPMRPYPTVAIEDPRGGLLAADHLVDMGYMSFAFVGETQRSDQYFSHAQARLEGFRNRLIERGFTLPPQNIRTTLNNTSASSQECIRFLSSIDTPIGVFAHTDVIASGVLHAARQLDRRIPSDVGVVGFDDSGLAEALDLTTIHQPLRESGTHGARLLLEEMRQNATAPASVALHVNLVIRGSTLEAG